MTKPRTHKIDAAVAQWLTHRDMNRAGDVLESMGRLCWFYTNKKKGFCNYSGVDLWDLYQEAQLGVVVALRRFDPEKAIKFSNYAVYHIKAKILKFIEKYTVVNFGNNEQRRSLIYNYDKLVHRFQKEHPLISTIDLHLMIAEELGCSKAQVDQFRAERLGYASLDTTPWGKDGKEGYHDFLTSDPDPENQNMEDLEKKEVRRHIASFCRKLKPRDADLVISRIAATDTADTLLTIGRRWGCTRERVRQVSDALEGQLVDYCRVRMVEGAEKGVF